jgi:hypothetical protein
MIALLILQAAARYPRNNDSATETAAQQGARRMELILTSVVYIAQLVFFGCVLISIIQCCRRCCGCKPREQTNEAQNLDDSLPPIVEENNVPRVEPGRSYPPLNVAYPVHPQPHAPRYAPIQQMPQVPQAPRYAPVQPMPHAQQPPYPPPRAGYYPGEPVYAQGYPRN